MCRRRDELGIRDGIRMYPCGDKPGKMRLVAVCKVPAAREVKGHHRIAHIQRGEIDSHVRRRTAMRLDVRVLGLKQFLRAFNSEPLGRIDMFTAAVPSRRRIAFRVFISEHRTLRLKHCPAHKVLACDEFYILLFAARLIYNRLVDLRIRFPEILHWLASRSDICFTLLRCLPPNLLVENHTSSIFLTLYIFIDFDPNTIIFASLCSRDERSLSTSETSAALTPRTLLATIDMPMPLLHINMPRENFLFPTAPATRNPYFG